MFEWLRRLWCSFGIQHWPAALSEHQELGDVNRHARCRFCDARIMQDSQGNWFN